MSNDLPSIYQQSLRNTHAAEHQGLVQMQAQVKGLGDYPEYQALLERHIETTKGQIARLDAEMVEADAGSAALRETVTTAAGAVGAAVHGVMPDATLKNLYAGYAFQFEQIAAYQSLAVIADAAGHGGHAGWIAESLEEERAAAREVEALIEPVTRQWLQLNGK